MNEDNIRLFGTLFSELRDLDQKRAGIFDEFLNNIGKPIMEATKAEKPTLEEINSQKWTDKTSEKGAYQTTSKQDNINSAAFQKLQKYLKDHNGFAILHGFKCWQFSNNPDILARRKQ